MIEPCARTLVAIVTLTPLLYSSVALGQHFPSKPVTMISTFGPGTPQDLIVRALTDLAGKELGQPVAVDPRPGAGGALTASATKAAKPDGYTIGTTTVAALAVLPQLQKVAYDPERDFTYIMQIGTFPIGVAVKADSPFRTWAEVIAKAKIAPNTITFGTPGQGSIANLGMQRILSDAGVAVTHVPHQGAQTIISAVLGGHITLQVTGTEWKPHVEAGTMRLLMMWTSERHASFPSVPTLRELGYPFDLDVGFGLYGPAGMEPALTKRLHNAFNSALQSAQVRDLMQKFDVLPAYADGSTFKAGTTRLASDLRPTIDKLGLARKD